VLRVGAVGPSDYVRGARGNYDAARALCADCPVRQECLEAALTDTDLMGLWGGTTETERREIRRRRVA
jgi:WhiB family transcriptional regulator, redox-sensing transcriptional regulator